jgi:hypothetical protein
VPTVRPEPERDESGLYLLPDPRTGRKRAWTRATTVAHALSDEAKIEAWKRRKVAEGLAMVYEGRASDEHDSMLADALELADAIRSCGDDYRAARTFKAGLDELVDQAADIAGANEGSAAGTDTHSLTEWWDTGRISEIEVPIDMLADLAAYVDVMEAEEIGRPAEHVERIIVNVTCNCAGTYDRLLRLPDGRLVVGDLKTQKSVSFGWLEIAIQLAIYANADRVLDYATGELVDMPDDIDRETGIVIHLPVGSAEARLWEVDLTAGWEAALLAAKVLDTRKRTRGMGRPYARLNAPLTAEARLLALINGARSLAALTALWGDPDARAVWGDEHTAAARARRAALERDPLADVLGSDAA